MIEIDGVEVRNLEEQVEWLTERAQEKSETIKDVKVNGESVVENGIAEIDIDTSEFQEKIESVVLTLPTFSTQGTLTAEQLDLLKKSTLNSIVVNNEIFTLQDKSSSIWVYACVDKANQIKTLNLTTSTRAFIISTANTGLNMTVLGSYFFSEPSGILFFGNSADLYKYKLFFIEIQDSVDMYPATASAVYSPVLDMPSGDTNYARLDIATTGYNPGNTPSKVYGVLGHLQVYEGSIVFVYGNFQGASSSCITIYGVN